MATSAAGLSTHYLTIAEVAAVMRVSRMTVYRLVNSHSMAAVRVGRSLRVPEQAVSDYISRATAPAAAATDSLMPDPMVPEGRRPVGKAP